MVDDGGGIGSKLFWELRELVRTVEVVHLCRLDMDHFRVAYQAEGRISEAVCLKLTE